MISLITQKLSPIQKEKVEKDLQTIDLLSKKGKELGFRVIISGGYAVDGFLHKITRYHEEIDVQIYGEKADAFSAVVELLELAGFDKEKLQIQDKGRKEYYHNFVINTDRNELDVYYLQIKSNPFDANKIIVKADGNLSEDQSYNTFKSEINGIHFESQDPLTEVVDKIYKREHRGDPKFSKHEQDIENLRKLIPEEKIQELLGRILNKK